MKHIRSIAALLLAGTLFPALSGTELKIDGIPLVRQDFASQEDMISAVYEEILVRFFISAGIPPNENDTFAFLKKLNSLLPAGLPGKSEAELQLLAKQRHNQLSTAARKFFAAKIPELEQIEPNELQKVYQQELKRFVSRGSLQCYAMMFNDFPAAQKARAELLQGGNFDTIRKKYQAIPPQGAASEFLPLLKAAHPRLSSMMVSDVLRGEKHCFVVLVQHFSPPVTLSLKEVEACLKEEIIAKRTAELLRHLLLRELPRHKIETPENGKK